MKHRRDEARVLPEDGETFQGVAAPKKQCRRVVRIVRSLSRYAHGMREIWPGSVT